MLVTRSGSRAPPRLRVRAKGPTASHEKVRVSPSSPPDCFEGFDALPWYLFAISVLLVARRVRRHALLVLPHVGAIEFLRHRHRDLLADFQLCAVCARSHRPRLLRRLARHQETIAPFIQRQSI